MCVDAYNLINERIFDTPPLTLAEVLALRRKLGTTALNAFF